MSDKFFDPFTMFKKKKNVNKNKMNIEGEEPGLFSNNNDNSKMDEERLPSQNIPKNCVRKTSYEENLMNLMKIQFKVKQFLTRKGLYTQNIEILKKKLKDLNILIRQVPAIKSKCFLNKDRLVELLQMFLIIWHNGGKNLIKFDPYSYPRASQKFKTKIRQEKHEFLDIFQQLVEIIG